MKKTKNTEGVLCKEITLKGFKTLGELMHLFYKFNQ